MLPQLDRWVVANLFGHIAAGDRARGGHGKAVYFVNVAGATLCDPDFPDYVAQQLKKFDVAGHAVCFEVVNADLVANRHDVEQFIKAVKLAGCRVALCGFGREQVSIALLKVLPLDFVKIDGSVILNVLRDPVAIGKVVTIHRVAREHGIITVAEMVEDRATEARLREASVEYAQGFGISQPHPLV
jgi:EAL domain-containing protein (putative c-di-GMP-specific phosphodiesterase class I)